MMYMRSVSLIQEPFQNLEKQLLDLPNWVRYMNETTEMILLYT